MMPAGARRIHWTARSPLDRWEARGEARKDSRSALMASGREATGTMRSTVESLNLSS